MKVSHHSLLTIMGWLSAPSPSPAPSSFTISIHPSIQYSKWSPVTIKTCDLAWTFWLVWLCHFVKHSSPSSYPTAVKTNIVKATKGCPTVISVGWEDEDVRHDMEIWILGRRTEVSLCVCLATCLILSLYLAYHPLCGLSGCSNHQRPCPRSWSRCFSQSGSRGCSSHHW